MLLYRPAQRLPTAPGSLPCVPSPGSRRRRSARASDPEALAQALQRKYDTVRDFSADFVHSYQGGVLRKTVTERGRLLVKKPGKMRWAYSGDEQKVFVSDGRKMYSYIPADKQVYVGTVPADDQASTPALFLAGKGSCCATSSSPRARCPRRAGRQRRAQAGAEARPTASTSGSSWSSTRRRCSSACS